MNLFHDSKIRQLLRAAEKQGFVIQHKSKSFAIIPSDKSKEIITFACTPSDQNAYWQLRRMLRRAGFVEKGFKQV